MESAQHIQPQQPQGAMPGGKWTLGKIVGLGCLLIVLAGAGCVGLTMMGLVGVAVKEQEKTETAKKAIQSGKIDAQVSAESLVAEYDSNEVASDQNYKNKIIEVTGRVKAIKKDLGNNMFITLDGSHVVRDVQCFFDSAEENSLASLSQGQTVVVVGKCDGLFMNVIVKHCKVK